MRAAARVGAVMMGVASMGATAPEAPALRHAFTIRAELLPAIEQGQVDGRRKRFVPISGGRIEGPRLRGVVLAGGGDWQTISADGLVEVFARYSLKADDGTVIDVTNPGVRVTSAEVTQRMAAGEDVPPDAYYFRTRPALLGCRRAARLAAPHRLRRSRCPAPRPRRNPGFRRRIARHHVQGEHR